MSYILSNPKTSMKSGYFQIRKSLKLGPFQFNKPISTAAAAATQDFYPCWLTVRAIWGSLRMSGSAKWISLMMMKMSSQICWKAALLSLHFSQTLMRVLSRGCWGKRVKQGEEVSSGMLKMSEWVKIQRLEERLLQHSRWQQESLTDRWTVLNWKTTGSDQVRVWWNGVYINSQVTCMGVLEHS